MDDLHRLGWHAFQQLCLTIARGVHGAGLSARVGGRSKRPGLVVSRKKAFTTTQVNPSGTRVVDGGLEGRASGIVLGKGRAHGREPDARVDDPHREPASLRRMAWSSSARPKDLAFLRQYEAQTRDDPGEE